MGVGPFCVRIPMCTRDASVPACKLSRVFDQSGRWLGLGHRRGPSPCVGAGLFHAATHQKLHHIPRPKRVPNGGNRLHLLDAAAQKAQLVDAVGLCETPWNERKRTSTSWGRAIYLRFCVRKVPNRPKLPARVPRMPAIRVHHHLGEEVGGGLVVVLARHALASVAHHRFDEKGRYLRLPAHPRLP